MSQFKGFTSVELKSPQKSMFDLTHDKRISLRMGKLTPCLIQEAIPGDKFRGSSDMLVRLAPLLAPIYDQIHVYVHYFFVPNRLLWEDWEEFITGGRNPGVDPVEPPIPPYVNLTADATSEMVTGTLADYLGVPDFEAIGGDYSVLKLDLMPFLAYQLVWFEYYRDRNFIGDSTMEFPVPSGQMASGTSEFANYVGIKTRDYQKDYFTSALPWTQRGQEVLMPLEGTGSVSYLPVSKLRYSDGSIPPNDVTLRGLGDGVTDSALNINDGANQSGRIENIDEVLLTASSVSINDFRSAYSLQVWLERNAIGGTRYTESIQAHFDVKPQDSRLQRPEYIGGGRVQVNISEVVSTSWSSDGSGNVPLGELAGRGVTVGNTNDYRYFCTEHGFIVGIVSVMAPATYYQGLPRMFYRRSFLDYPWPTFAKLGEQAVDKVELYASPTNMTEDADGERPRFGYQSRYADWKFVPNSVHGEFRTTLLHWTLTRSFSNSPTLSTTFLAFPSDVQDQIFAVEGEDNIWLYIHNNLSVVRALPYFGTPNTLNF